MLKTNLHEGKQVSPPCNSSPGVRRVSRSTQWNGHEASHFVPDLFPKNLELRKSNHGDTHLYKASCIIGRRAKWLGVDPRKANVT